MSLQEATNTPRNIKNKFSVSKKQQMKRTHQITLLQSTVDLAGLEKKLVHTIRKSQGFNEKQMEFSNSNKWLNGMQLRD